MYLYLPEVSKNNLIELCVLTFLSVELGDNRFKDINDSKSLGLCIQ